MTRSALVVALAVLSASPAVAGCGSGGSDGGTSTSTSTSTGGGTSAPAAPAAGREVDPARFVRHVTNPWYPLRPGTTYRWAGTDNGRPTSDVLQVTHRTKRIQGVTTTVLLDRAYVRGRLSESTIDWYAQDRAGNVWYFGERTRNIAKDGTVKSTAGSWEAGVDGAKAGIFMPARPHVGQSFQQEHYTGHAEDHFTVRSLHASIRVPYVTSHRALRTTETSPLEPGVVDAKYYVRGLGTVLEASIKGPDHERLELVSVRRGG